MKKMIFAAALVLSIFSIKRADAQLSISLNLNIGSQPDWGPTGYDHVEYYYLPDIDCYYYVPGKQFVYRSGSQWVWRSTLPQQYSNYDLYNSYKVVVNKPKPYIQDDDYRSRYTSFKGRHDQPLIRDSRDEKYKHHADNSRPVTKPAPSRPPVNNHPSHGKKPVAHTTPEHRPATDNHPTPAKPKPGGRHPQDKKDEKGHH